MLDLCLEAAHALEPAVLDNENVISVRNGTLTLLRTADDWAGAGCNRTNT